MKLSCIVLVLFLVTLAAYSDVGSSSSEEYKGGYYPGNAYHYHSGGSYHGSGYHGGYKGKYYGKAKKYYYKYKNSGKYKYLKKARKYHRKGYKYYGGSS
uniref:Polyphenolic phosphoprotein mefp-5 n=1 Tax=Mytilus edulis TaxID=6550 RepID=Q8WTE8_MYTED|nr:polyphenolic phosphoprotein mefp-5 precursor [Mytilus edulis]